MAIHAFARSRNCYCYARFSYADAAQKKLGRYKEKQPGKKQKNRKKNDTQTLKRKRYTQDGENTQHRTNMLRNYCSMLIVLDGKVC